MATQYQRDSVTRLLCTLVLSSILMACGTGLRAPQEAPPPAPDIFSLIDRPADQYQALAERAPEPDAFNWRVLAIRSALQQGDAATAGQQLEVLRRQASPQQQSILGVLEAALALTQNNPAGALQQLATVDRTRLSRGGEIYYLQLQANALELQQQPLEAAKVLIERQELLSGDERETNRGHIHHLLQSLSPQSLRQAQGPGNTDLANGWFRLMAILNSDNLQPGQRQWQLQSWRTAYPDHPGQAYVVGTPAEPVVTSAYQPAHIAVLLPLSGRLAEQADAIRNGILSAHQGQTSRLSFFDTNGRAMNSLYQQVQQAGADFILGPLLKEEVDALTELDPAMPVLALNVPAYQPGLPHLYYFALSPEAEAAEAARHMWDQGHRQPLVFAPNNELGRRVATEFGQRWQQQSGRPAILAYFAGQSSIESDVRRALASAGSPPPAAAGVIQPLGDGGWTGAPGPIDSVFMVTNATETRVILPYFDFVRDSRAARLPTYVTSRSYIPDDDAPMSELNGLQLADMPWIFDGAPQLRQEVDALWPNAGITWQRLFAFGYDALTLIPQLSQLREGAPPVPALTGELTASPQGVLQRRLQWMEYRNGEWLPGGQ
ncbi:penicillin-binding protein activator [Zobellella sp. CGMCC 1.18722]|uniref:Penicillin-binding protein activator n=1 Tax=Zobellella iuensis TaxID=2803811 RepID=A0ABS1QR73_9GAMM|nr:penicillin-binding protein activator [Zobellella iuensis]MBL1376754.1 penicillin-binding protein activator [Zobellella iuensis]